MLRCDFGGRLLCCGRFSSPDAKNFHSLLLRSFRNNDILVDGPRLGCFHSNVTQRGLNE